MTSERRPLLGQSLGAVLLLCCSAALAHEDHGTADGLLSGFLHPFGGLDHMVAMVAVGLWGAFLGAPALWLLPVVFPLVMAMGGAMGVMGLPLPMVELGIAASALVLGLAVLLAARPPLWLAAVVVGAFAIFHGHAHGTELPGATSPLSYSLGFVLATGALHAVGMAFGLLLRWPRGQWVLRGGGGLIALAGLGFLTGML